MPQTPFQRLTLCDGINLAIVNSSAAQALVNSLLMTRPVEAPDVHATSVLSAVSDARSASSSAREIACSDVS